MLAILKKRKLPAAIISCILVVAILAVIILPSIQGNASASANVRSGAAQRGTIAATVTGTGNLANDSAVWVTVPTGLTVDQVFVEAGDPVQAGEALARFEPGSIQSQTAVVQAGIDSLDEQIQAEGEQGDIKVSANVSGRVKALYVQQGDSVTEAMLAHGALALLSLDGLMAVNLDTDTGLKAGEKVTVYLSDGTSVSGTVEQAEGGVVVTLTDNGPALDETVEVYSQDGVLLGSGQLFVHRGLTVTGTSGTVETVHISENSLVDVGTVMLTLTDTGPTAQYLALLDERETQVELLHQLLTLSQNGGMLYAEAAGTVESVALSGADSGQDSATVGTPDTSTYGAWASMMGHEGQGGSAITLLSALQQGSVDEPEGSEPTEAPEPTEEPQEPEQPETPEPVEISSVGGIALTPPQTATVPQRTIDGGDVFVGQVQWTPAHDIFYPQTVYTAQVTLRANSGFAFHQDSVASLTGAGFLPAGATVASAELDFVGEGNTLAFTVTYPATAPLDSGLGGDVDWSGILGGGGYGSSGSISLDGYSAGAYSLDGAALDSGGISAAVASGDAVNALSISENTHMRLTVAVDELDILSLAQGQEATVTLDAVEGEQFAGVINRVNTAGTASGGVTKYAVDILVERTEQMLSGMTASAVITIDEAEDILIIPVAALQEAAGRVYVYTALESDGETLTGQVDVTTGLSDGVYVEITDGLAEGDPVYYTVTENTSDWESFGFGRHAGGTD